jgi:hypothetical protein
MYGFWAFEARLNHLAQIALKSDADPQKQIALFKKTQVDACGLDISLDDFRLNRFRRKKSARQE